jgi:hypothetical protein
MFGLWIHLQMLAIGTTERHHPEATGTLLKIAQIAINDYGG